MKFRPIVAADIYGILTRKVLGSELVIKEEAIGTQFLFSHSIFALDVRVTLARNWIRSVNIWTAAGSLLLTHQVLLLLLVELVELGLGLERRGPKAIRELRQS